MPNKHHQSEEAEREAFKTPPHAISGKTYVSVDMVKWLLAVSFLLGLGQATSTYLQIRVLTEFADHKRIDWTIVDQREFADRLRFGNGTNLFVPDVDLKNKIVFQQTP